MKKKYLLQFLLALLLVLPAIAQERTSAINGLITDQSDAVVSGAAIQVLNLDTGEIREARSSEDGAYRISSLEIGRYKVTASLDGFKSSVHVPVVLELGLEAFVNHVLEIGDASGSVTVTGDSWLVGASPATVSSLVGSRVLEGLPVNGRDYVQLAVLQAGAVVARGQERNANTGYGVQISISGSRPTQNSFHLDGVSINSYNNSTPGSVNGLNLGMDAIQEFSIQTSAFSAQHGRASGGTIHAVTKSGGNDFHGAAFYFHRNDNLDARGFFDPESKPEFRRHQFGGSLGGPIAKDRAFFFANYEGLEQSRGNTSIDTTLSPAARNGHLTTGTVPVDPVMAKVVALYPEPQGEILGDTALYVFANNNLSRENFVTSRVDVHLGAKDRLFTRYTLTNSERENQTTYQLGLQRDTSRPQSAVVEETHIFSPTALNTARLGFLRTTTVAGRTTTSVAGTDDPSLAFLPASGVIGIIEVSGLSDFPGGTGALDSDVHHFNSYQISDDLTVTRGGHTIKLGGRFERTQFNTDSQNRVSGEYGFNSIADFLTNKPRRFRAQFPGSDTIRGHRQWIGAFYLQDTWRVNKNLTVDLGLRYEWATVPAEVNGKVSNLDNLTDAEMRVGEPLFKTSSRTIPAPRVGLAWDLFGNGRTIVRTGYGLYPDPILSHFLILSGVRNPPFFRRGSTSALKPGDFPKGGYEVFAANPEADLRIDRYPPMIEQPYVQHWNLGFEQRFDASTSVRLYYTGTHGLHLSILNDDANLVDPVILPDGRRFYPPDGEKINPHFSAIRNRSFDGHSFYHGLQTRFLRRMTGGLSLEASYGFSKAIDDGSLSVGATSESINSGYSAVPGDPRLDRGLSAFDVRHHFALSGIWDVPSVKGSGFKKLLQGWRLATIVTHSSGLPVSAWLGYDGAGTRSSRSDWRSGQRPDLAPGVNGIPATGDPNGWVDPTPFLRPEPGFLGNLGRNTITGPSTSGVDFSVVKRTALREQLALDFRFEFFNLFNQTSFRLPDPQRMEVFPNGRLREDFGRLTGAAPGREIQLGVKIVF